MPKSADVWFEALEEIGQKPMMTFGRLNPKDNSVDMFELEHSKYDGIGGIYHLMGKESQKTLEYNLNKRPTPGFIEKLKALYYYNPESKLRHTSWKSYDRQIPAESKGIFHYCFSEDQLSSLYKKAKENRCSLQIYILKKFDQFINENYLNEHQERWWMIPVNMRKESELRSEENLSSYISVQIDDNISYRELMGQMILKLKRNTHWAAWFWMLFIPLLGKGAVRKALKHYDEQNHGWAGIFTFIDYKLHLNNKLIDGTVDEYWFGCAPITKAHPVACNLIKGHDKLMIATQIHQGIVPTKDDWEKGMKKFITDLI